MAASSSMPEASEVLIVVREWVAKAESDLLTATHTLKLGDRCPTGAVCFHAQQCAEKYFKALLVADGKAPPKTHSIHMLMESLPKPKRPSLTAEEEETLTHHSVALRYPGVPEPTLAEARDAVRLARRVRAVVRRLLPRDALRPR
jgi:HEPN domain-containing protein